MYVLFIYIFSLKTNAAPRNPEYGFASYAELDTFISNLQQLETRVPCWPPVSELLKHANRFDLIQQLDKAATLLHTPRPLTKQLGPTDSVTAGWVVKRTFSQRYNHTIIVSNETPVVQLDSRPGTNWIAQELIEPLLCLGEVRMGIVEGRHIVFRTHAVSTGNQWELEEVSRLRPILKEQLE